MIALNGFDHTGMAAKIKRLRKISLKELREKVDVLPPKTFVEYAFSLRGLSIEDM